MIFALNPKETPTIIVVHSNWYFATN
jgi:hypothetical protein